MQDFPEGVARQISITGRPDAVQRAVSMVSELIQGEPGSAQAIIQKVLGAAVSLYVLVPHAANSPMSWGHELVGLMIF